MRTLRGHEGSIYSLSYSSDGALLVSGGSDATVRVWDAKLAASPQPSGAGGHSGASSAAAAAAAAAAASTSSTFQMMLGGATGGRPTAPCTAELLATYPTKLTPVFKVHFTRQNLLLASGPFCPP